MKWSYCDKRGPSARVVFCGEVIWEANHFAEVSPSPVLGRVGSTTSEVQVCDSHPSKTTKGGAPISSIILDKTRDKKMGHPAADESSLVASRNPGDFRIMKSELRRSGRVQPGT